MKVLQVINAFYPPYSSGGAAFVAHNVSKALAKRGHEVTVYTTNAFSRDRLFNPKQNPRYNNEVKVCYFTNMVYKPSSLFYFSKELVKAIKKSVVNYDVVHLHEYRSYISLVTSYCAKKYDVPYILQVHGQLPRIMVKKRLKWVFDLFFGRRLLRDSSKVIALSQMEAEQYRGMGVPEEKIAFIPNGIDLSEYADLPPKGSFKKKFGIEDNKKVALYLGRIHKSKGLDMLVRAFKIVCEDSSNVRLAVVGPDDGYAHALFKLISDLRLEEKVLLTGFVEERDKLASLVDSDVFVTPRFHGFPVTFLEACLARCPIVTISNELDWIHDNVGYVVENSPTSLAKAISNILQDEQVHRRLRNNCRHIIKNFSISMIASRLENAYKSVAR